METKQRSVERVVEGRATSDGAGVRLKRSLGSPELEQLDPFLLLDEIKSDDSSDYIAGIPDHPHRGFETVTYMLAGHMEHRDHMGNRGLLEAGSVQWMTAGRGIVHSEMPRQEAGLMWGFQLWVNLPAKDKMSPPRYQDIPPDAVPELARDSGSKLRLIAGEVDGVAGAVGGIATAPLYIDARLPAAATESIAVPRGHTALCYAYEGSLSVGDRVLHAGQLAVLGDGELVRLSTAHQPARCLLIAGRPIGEPIARYGPFVMNTREEIMQAVRDFQSGRLS
jgi:redox-sensitive bicupin YhaK (pirin superfamily)